MPSTRIMPDRTTAVVQRRLDALAGDTPADPLIRHRRPPVWIVKWPTDTPLPRFDVSNGLPPTTTPLPTPVPRVIPTTSSRSRAAPKRHSASCRRGTIVDAADWQPELRFECLAQRVFLDAEHLPREATI